MVASEFVPDIFIHWPMSGAELINVKRGQKWAEQAMVIDCSRLGVNLRPETERWMNRWTDREQCTADQVQWSDWFDLFSLWITLEVCEMELA